MKIYSPENNTTHKVKINFMYEDYKGSMEVEIRGNCSGIDIINCAIDLIEGYCPNMKNKINKKHINLSTDGFIDSFSLFNKKGEELIIEASDIADFTIEVKIIGYYKEVKK